MTHPVDELVTVIPATPARYWTIPAPPSIRARDWLRQHSLAFRGAILLEHDDAGITDMALMEDGVALTCPGDIQRERDAAVLRSAA